jgi:hypothetical protein
MTTEMDHLRAFRTEDAAPDATASTAARAALMERIEAEAAALSPHAAATASTAPASTSAAGPAPAARDRARHSRRRPAWLRRGLPALAGGAALATAAAAAIAVTSGIDAGGVAPPPASAAEVLRHAAAVASKAPDLALAPGQRLHTRTEGTELFTNYRRRSYLAIMTMRTDEWVGADGRGRLRWQMAGEPAFPTSVERAEWIADGRRSLTGGRTGPIDLPPDAPAELHGKPYWLGHTPITYEQLRRLPADPVALAARIADGLRPGATPAQVPGQLFDAAGYLLAQTPAPPALRSALYRVIANVPGVELLGEARDARGRAGTAVARTADGKRVELVFDPRTALLLEQRTIWTADERVPMPPPGVRGVGKRQLVTPRGTALRTTYLETEVVGAAPRAKP